MSWFTSIRDFGESLLSDVSPIDFRGESARKQTGGLTGMLNKGRDVEADLYHKFTGTPTAEDKRNQQTMMNDQIQAYKDQTELSRQALNDKRNSEQVEKRRIQEKQIRGLRRNYSSQGFLGGSGQSSEPDMNSQLGG